MTLPRLLLNHELYNCDTLRAEENFQLILDILPNLQILLNEALEELGVDKALVQINESIESLGRIDSLLRDILHFREKTQEEIQREIDATPNQLLKFAENSPVFNQASFEILNLIGLYFGQLLVQNNHPFKWALERRKGYTTSKQPYVEGIDRKQCFPSTVVTTHSYRLLENKPEESLIEIYNKYENYLNGRFQFKLPEINKKKKSNS